MDRQVDVRSLLKTTAPYVAVPIPGQRPIVIERLRLQRALRGVTILSADTICAEQRALTVFYKHKGGRGRAVFYDRTNPVGGRIFIARKNEEWAHRERHKRGIPCEDRFCRIQPRQSAKERLLETLRIDDAEATI